MSTALDDDQNWGNVTTNAAAWGIKRLGLRFYNIFIAPFLRHPIAHQRVRRLWYIRGYLALLTISSLSWKQRLTLVTKFWRIDWNILTSERPTETARVCRDLASRPAQENEVVVEAGAFHGASSAKWSIICKMLGYRVLVFDSFEGVPELASEEQEREGIYTHGGRFLSSEEIVRENVRKYGVIEVCEFYKGWYSDTLAKSTIIRPVRLAFLSCDLVRSASDALAGIVPMLVEDGVIYSADYGAAPMREYLHSSATWAAFNKSVPTIEPYSYDLVRLSFT